MFTHDPNDPAAAFAADTVQTVTETPTGTLDERMTLAVDDALARGADVSIALLDRLEGTYSAVADGTSFPTASVVKLFIADDVLFREARAEHELTPEEHDLIGRMLERSDDDAANTLWNEYGGPEIVEDVVGRYHLTATTTPYDDNWWNTETTPADLVDYYAGLLDGRGGLDDGRRTEILTHLRASNATSTEGYDQRFGLPDGLGAETTLAVKQGWMCCIDDRWTHVSTGIVGEHDRYVLVVVSREDLDYGDDDADYPDTSLTAAVDDVSAAHARETVTEVVRTVFPLQRIA
ncbi:hypothetical protein GS505_02455 [Rhodococcus hoagii]|uniref:Beta-lactamase class A catalytic domain-containing protein n=1 Tax=Rhodococcus hoagii TaxID=43767 RepID=A0AAE4ZD94_RHOHA|nr:hypothetical protein [Prescottella equi]